MWNMKHFAIIFVGREVMHEIFFLFLWNLKQSKVVNYVHFWFEETLIILTSKVLQCCWDYNAHMHDIDINFEFEKNTTNDMIQWFFTSYTKLGIILCPNSKFISHAWHIIVRLSKSSLSFRSTTFYLNDYSTEWLPDSKRLQALYNLNTFVSTRKVSRSTQDACLL